MSAAPLYEASGRDWTVTVEHNVLNRSPVIRQAEIMVQCAEDWDSSPATLAPDDARAFAEALVEATRVVAGANETQEPS